MKLDRGLQKRILMFLADVFPNPVHPSDARALIGEIGEDSLFANLIYLEQHGLIQSGLVAGTSEYIWNAGQAQISHHGLDFLADDGGLSAILGVVTVKLHDDTLKSLIEAKILQSDLAQPDKKRWLDQLRELPAETTKHLAMKLVDLGLASGPAAIAAIGTYLGS